MRNILQAPVPQPINYIWPVRDLGRMISHSRCTLTLLLITWRRERLLRTEAFTRPCLFRSTRVKPMVASMTMTNQETTRRKMKKIISTQAEERDTNVAATTRLLKSMIALTSVVIRLMGQKAPSTCIWRSSIRPVAKPGGKNLQEILWLRSAMVLKSPMTRCTKCSTYHLV